MADSTVEALVTTVKVGVVKRFTLHEPSTGLGPPPGPGVVSSTYRLHLLFGSAPAKALLRVATYGAAGAGGRKFSAALSVGLYELPETRGEFTGALADASSLKVKVALLNGALPVELAPEPLSSTTALLPGPTSRKPRSGAEGWVKPFTVTLTFSIVPIMFDLVKSIDDG